MDELLELREWVTEQLEEITEEESYTVLLNSLEGLQVERIVWEKMYKKLNEMILNY